MTNNVMERIGSTGLVPVVVIDNASTAVSTAKALLAGGVDIMEITMRTQAGMESIRRVAKECPDMLVGAGTVLTMDQCIAAIDNGASFIVSPGFDPEIVDYCINSGVPICPGCVTPTEISAAIKKGLDVVKFFPANVYGGIKAIKALSGPFTGLQFIPTGGVGLSNLSDFVHFPILAIGGGWLCTRNDINSGKFNSITEICCKSVDVLLCLKEDGKNIPLAELIEKGGLATTISIPRTTSQLTRRGFEVQTLSTGLSFRKGSVSIIIAAE